ncbi:acyltransferase family protein [Stutzerimonas stutzeri]|uniref:acyltransferase family protein n=1 Tax=Stutzerimonas stutzeri TaxID=316 RepID=UPI00265B04FE|nr:acyltransferase family protein [Stutzerimonas stutzeri]MCF6782316.1 acyltransferase [Stutzerimonas stutzeri]MCF6805362.1 acyltransferase [Stutzerimonas stutzeri]
MTNPNIKYRPDIDGLRAVAVLSVVIYHAFPSLLKGGFIGVDIFFVISGFLISTIIFNSLGNNKFSLREFYARRIRRIFPALILVLASTYALGWLTLTAEEFRQLGKHIFSGSIFVSNFALWDEAGYFDKSADLKPLLHLWSLGIEEQFYIAWPIIIYACWKLGIRLLPILLLATAASFALNISGARYDEAATFFSPQTRFWELLCGSLLAWITLHRAETLTSIKRHIDRRIKLGGASFSDNATATIGVGLLIFGFVRIDEEAIFPGMLALIPVGGAALLILAGPTNWISKGLLKRKPMVWVGLISFPLYLWHWPIISFFRIHGDEPGAVALAIAIALSVGLAWVTYSLVERPLRRASFERKKVYALVFMMCISAGVGGFTYKSDGLQFRSAHKLFAGYAESIVRATDKHKGCVNIPYAYKKKDEWFCKLGVEKARHDIFVFGDSHAFSLIPALDKFGLRHKKSIAFSSASGCPPLLGIQSLRGARLIEEFNCRLLNERIFDYVYRNKIRTAMLIGRWPYYGQSTTRPRQFNAIAREVDDKPTAQQSGESMRWAMAETAERYRAIGVQIIFVEDNPQQLHSPERILKKGRGQEKRYNELAVSVNEHRHNQRFSKEAIKATGAPSVNFDKFLCESEICPLARSGQFLYWEDDHLSITGALAVYPALEESLLRIMSIDIASPAQSTDAN